MTALAQSDDGQLRALLARRCAAAQKRYMAVMEAGPGESAPRWRSQACTIADLQAIEAEAQSRGWQIEPMVAKAAWHLMLVERRDDLLTWAAIYMGLSLLAERQQEARKGEALTGNKQESRK